MNPPRLSDTAVAGAVRALESQVFEARSAMRAFDFVLHDVLDCGGQVSPQMVKRAFPQLEQYEVVLIDEKQGDVIRHLGWNALQKIEALHTAFFAAIERGERP